MTEPTKPEPRYPFVMCDVPEADADEASALLFELGASGVEQRDATTVVRGSSGPTVTLVASFDDPGAAAAAIADVPGVWNARAGEVVGDGWRDEWKRYFEPFLLCRSVFVRPPWRECAPPSGEHVLLLEPGRAFGTGLHETTRLVAEVLADGGDALRGARLLDVGCGSGILALTALALGASSARAVDVDPDAVTVTRENADRNDLAHRVDVDDTDIAAVEGTFAWVVANIEAAPLVGMAPALVARVAPRGRLVLSGILAPEVAPQQWESVRRAYGALQVEELRRDGEWIAAVMRA